jgi:hypothetical protein
VESAQTDARAGTLERPGVYVVGQLVRAEPGATYKTRAGEIKRDFEVGVVVGREVFTVKFQGEDEFMSACPDAAAGRVVRIPCFVRAFAFERRGRWEAAVDYRGRVPREV